MTNKERMSDERLTQAEVIINRETNPDTATELGWSLLELELLQALKAEREYAERTCEWAAQTNDPFTEFDTSCGRCSDTNPMLQTYCQYCGGKIVETNDE